MMDSDELRTLPRSKYRYLNSAPVRWSGRAMEHEPCLCLLEVHAGKWAKCGIVCVGKALVGVWFGFDAIGRKWRS